MSALGDIFSKRSIENPANPITSADLGAFTDVTSNIPVSELRAYGLTSYYRAISLVSSTLAALPMKVYDRESRRPVRNEVLVLRRPNVSQTRFEFWQTMYANALSWGNAYAIKDRDGTANRTVTGLRPIHPGKVRLEVVAATEENPTGKIFHVQTKSGLFRLTDYEIFHLPYLSIDGAEGLRPLALARQVLGVAVAAENTAASFYGKGNLLSGVLSTEAKLDAETAGRIKQRWQQRVAGQNNAGEVAVLDAGMKFSPISIPPEDAELLASRRFGVQEVARLFGIPPHLLGEVEKSTSWGTGIESQFISWVQTSLSGWITLVEQRVERDLLPGGTFGPYYAEYVLDGLLRGDSASRSEFYGKAIQWGWMNRNEIRQKENLEPVEGLEYYLTPLNMGITTADGVEMAKVSDAGE